MQKKQLSLQDPQVKILIVTIGIIFALYVISQKFILKPHKEKITNLRTNIEHIKLEDEIAKIHDEVTKQEKNLPPQKDPSWLLTQLTELIAQSKLNVESIEPLELKEIPPYSYVSFKIKLTCAYNQLLSFLKLTEQSSYILYVENLKLESRGKYSPEVAKEELTKETIASVEVAIGTIY